MNIRLISTCSLVAALSIAASNSLSAAIVGAKPIAQAAPVYAHELRASGTEGEVVVGFTITSAGTVSNPVVVSSTDRLFDVSALSAVRTWKFSPATDGGVAISVKAVQPIAFTMPELHPDSAARLVTLKSKPIQQAAKTGNLD